jgi:succinyl-diaminopimelate desuccinylase
MIDLIRKEAGSGIVVEILVGAKPTHLAPDPLYFEVAAEIAGTDITPVRASGGSDARFIAEAGISAVLSRPKVGNLHGLDEWIDIASMTSFFQGYRRYIERRLSVG